MTPEIKRLIRKKQRIYNKVKKYTTSKNKVAFRDIRNKIRNKLHTSYYNYLNNMLDPEKTTTPKNSGSSSKTGNRTQLE